MLQNLLEVKILKMYLKRGNKQALLMFISEVFFPMFKIKKCSLLRLAQKLYFCTRN